MDNNKHSNFSFKTILANDNVKTLIALFLLCLVIYIFRPDVFLTSNNLFNILRQTSLNAIIAIGIIFVIITAGIDLSVGAIAGFTAMVMAIMIHNEIALPIVLLSGILLGTTLGAISGFFVAKVKMAPFIATMSMMTMLSGATLVISEGRPITSLGDTFGFIGTGYIGPIPFPVILTVIIAIIAHYVLSYTPFGRHVYSVGGNEEASRLSGINVDRVKISVYAISGLLATITGAIMAARVDSATPLAGDGAELDAIAAAVIGGVSLNGGKGTIIGVLIGALIIGVLSNGMVLLDVNVFYTKIVKGFVILIAVVLDKMSTSNPA